MDQGATIDEAVASLERAVAQLGRPSRYNVVLGEAYLLRGDPALAAHHLAKGEAFQPEPRTQLLLAIAEHRLGRLAEAEQACTRALGSSACCERALLERATVRREAGDRRGALADLQALSTLARGDEGTWLRLARLLLEHAEDLENHAREGVLRDAKRLLRFSAQTEQHRAEWLYLMGAAQLALGEARSALGCFQATTFPSAPEVAFRRAICHWLLDERDEAAAALDLAAGDAALEGAIERYRALLLAGGVADAFRHRPPPISGESGLFETPPAVV